MVAQRFDDLSRFVSRRSSRRAWFASSAGALATLLSPAMAERAAAKKKKKKQAKTFRFSANPMTGAKEVAPTVGDPAGQGTASFTIKGKKICGTFNLSAATSFTVTGTHIHEGGASVNGPIVVDFGVATLGVQKCLTGGGILNQIKANPSGYYANIHTDTNLAGAVREQLVKA